MVRLRYLYAVPVLCLPAHAALMYTFTYTAGGAAETSIANSFTFSITSASFITTSINPLPPFSSFNVTDTMSRTFTLTTGRADFDPINMTECFTFGAATGDTLSNCGGMVSTGSVLLANFKPVPMAVGTYAPIAFQGNFGSDSADFINGSPGTGSMSLTISTVTDGGGVPEPPSVFLATAGFTVLAWMVRRRGGLLWFGQT